MGTNAVMNFKRDMHSSDEAGLIRYMGTFEREQNLRITDMESGLFLSKPELFLARFPLSRFIMRKIIQKRHPGVYEFIIARTLYFDKMITKIVMENPIKQFVVLGAGLDSRAYRFNDLFQQYGIKVFEMDLPKVQSRKKHKITTELKEKEGITRNIQFIPIDFNREDVGEKLLNNGYRKGVSTLFLWEGVTPYLEGKSARSIFEFISAQAASGSFLLFDFISSGFIQGKADSYYGGKEYQAVLKQKQIYLYFGIDENKLIDFINGYRFKLENYLSAVDLENECLRKPNGSILGKVGGFNHVAVLKVI